MKRCLIECGVPQASEADALAMNVSEPGKNVNLRIDYISRSMIGNIPDLLIDLLEVAAYAPAFMNQPRWSMNPAPKSRITRISTPSTSQPERLSTCGPSAPER
ncbi:hypothetical protein SAMN05421641_1462 [Paracoccus thiocyanatus]|uniref:Uncharacterized protein n=1 Tax=Paracoccus thiocyanatus TaxID=34006 RepID=A0A1N7ABL1_9RHOB|nr:hypothetical protein SAMN05421641_1462 [Paracoccus thiocyanatus]